MEFELRLDAVIVAVTDDQPRILTVGGKDGDTRPRLPFASVGEESTLDRSMRSGIEEQTGLAVSYVEQLYTFGDVGRLPSSVDLRMITIAYLALVQETDRSDGVEWFGYYELLPWEDHRDGPPPVIEETITPALRTWAGEDSDRTARVAMTFGEPFDGVRALERYELLYEIGLVEESWVDRGQQCSSSEVVGVSMDLDGRRIAATALARLRGKLSYRPVVFDLIAESFTLLELQRAVEALVGVRLHKQNFRRLVEGSGLVEGTGELARHQGRPAERFRYRPEVQLERSRPGVGQPYR